MSTPELPDDALYVGIRDLLVDSRAHVVPAIDTAMVQTYWHIGGLIDERLGAETRSESYGTDLMGMLSRQLTSEFGKGYDPSNLGNMLQFFRGFEIRDAARHESSTGRVVVDTRRCVDPGVDGVLLSSHGGSQLGRAPVPFELLPNVVLEVGADTEVMIDTGIMSGADMTESGRVLRGLRHVDHLVGIPVYSAPRRNVQRAREPGRRLMLRCMRMSCSVRTRSLWVAAYATPARYNGDDGFISHLERRLRRRLS